jgi:Uma2 family endonuclease
MSAIVPPLPRPFQLADAAGTYQFSAEQYHRLLDAGILREGEPAELLDGYIVKTRDRDAGRSGSALFPQWSGLRPFTVAEYHKMIDAGILTPDDRVELLDGYLVNKMPQNTPHCSAVQRLNKRLIRMPLIGWDIRCQAPITLVSGEPEPDCAIVRGDDWTFDTRHPEPADFGIVIEVADSSLLTDRRDKGVIYARAGIPIYWIVNVGDRRVEHYSDPRPTATPPAYATRTDYLPGQDVPITLDGQVVASIAVADLVP